ncbi:T4SS effector SidA family protein [Legionella worsleiensis]|uniref:SidA protein, subsrate of the Dot/Icm transport system n=1 Tax=Legionella worsleiensis TaxID=45076 RepID=A0A0W1A3H8_9GAMM|nr:T4SS effector SidA family protein [Legionella worsleiensis]KTD75785.1 SidA protein, subsrate of the Dot/Icm transport system [Legionella worsleiensis]STY32803.1 SidA protein, subsrate of the Dot/Icm transport system [Legionella worsleiensis]
MAKNTKKKYKLSEKMQRLKKHILNLLSEKKTFMEKVHERSKFIALITLGINNAFNIIVALFRSFKTIPIIGGIFQTIAAIPMVISLISDPTITLKQKALGGILCLTIGAVALAAFFLLNVAVMIFAIIGSSLFTLFLGYESISLLMDKIDSSKNYHEQKELRSLIESRNYPDGDEYNEQLEIRAVQLNYILARKSLKKERKTLLKEELEFINAILEQKKIIIGANTANKAAKLAKLYKSHQLQLEQLTKILAEKLPLVTEEINDDDELLQEIHAIQMAILSTRKDIANIIKPLAEYDFEYTLAKGKLGLSLSSLTINTITTIISILILLIGMGVITAQPVLFPILIAIDTTFAVLGLMRWIAEKVTLHEEQSHQRKNEERQKEGILIEALCAYEYALEKNNAAAPENSNPTVPDYVIANTAKADSVKHNKSLKFFDKQEEKPACQAADLFVVFDENDILANMP